MAKKKEKPTFKSGIGKWAGTAEVYDGQGQFLGHALDRRNVKQISENQVQINLSFMGPLMLSGHYIIESHENHRLYKGPANVGYAEALGEGLVEAHNYWSHWGLSQRFFLYVTPEKDMQMSLALLSRGEQLQYVVVGEYYRMPEGEQEEQTNEDGPVIVPDSLLIPGTPADKKNDPTAGRGEIVIHREGTWQGDTIVLDGQGQQIKALKLSQSTTLTSDKSLKIKVKGAAFVKSPYTLALQTNDWQAWTGAGDIVGSYSLSGGRALSGDFHHLEDSIRVWKREVITGDGNKKAILHVFYRGGERIGLQYGLLSYKK